MSGEVEMVEYWVLGDWQVVHWKQLPVTDVSVRQWFTLHDTTIAEPNPDDSHYASLNEALLVMVALAYVGYGVEDPSDAQTLAFGFARQIGMHTWDGEEWVHHLPGARW